MGTAQSKDDACESEEFQQMKRVFEEKGVAAAQIAMKEKLEKWRDVEIKIGVTGNSGVGKSSFINTIRGIDDEDESAATTDVVETTYEPACCTYPDNPKITLMDLPGIGTPNYPDLETYCKKVGLETYDTFLILTATRFTQHELELAQKIKSMKKSFLLIRTKIDIDEMNEKRKKKHNVENMLRKIRAYCHGSVKNLEIREDEIFLISNHEKDNWDFDRLVQAILEKLSTQQKEALTLSLKNLSKDIVKTKVEVIRSRLWSWMFELQFLVIEFVASDSSLYRIAQTEIEQRTKFYTSQLGLPEEDSDEFKMMKPEFQEKMRTFYPEKDEFWESYFEHIFQKHIDELVELPLLIIRTSLDRLLNEMESLSLAILDEAATRTTGDMDRDQPEK